MIVQAPLAGLVVPLAQVPDAVFASGMLGPGAAVRPGGGTVTAAAPIGGTVLTLRSHAYVIVGDDGRGVLVHLGLDTVELDGRGFTPLLAAGARVGAGDPVTVWDTRELGGRSPLCPVVALEAVAVSGTPAGEVRVGDRLFVWNNSPSKEDHG